MDMCSHLEVALFPKQTIVTRLTMEADLTALGTTTVQAEWFRELLMDLSVVNFFLILAILMNYDNQKVAIKVNSSNDNMKSSRHEKRRLKCDMKIKKTPEL